MRIRLAALAALLATTLTGAGCVFDHPNESAVLPFAPTSLGGLPAPVAGALMGLWASGAGSTGNCTNFQWNATSQTESAVSGTFSMVCGGTMLIAGTASGQLNGTSVAIEATGTATVPGVIFTCDCSLTATGQLVGTDTLQLTYSGTTCLGPVSGEETLRRPA